MAAQEPHVTEADRQALLDVARAALTAHLTSHTMPDVPAAGISGQGVFVTLHQGAELRGCIGRLAVDGPIAPAVAHCAVAAAISDPRFPPVTAAELPHLAIEISVLGPFTPIVDLEDVEIGRHGLLVESGRHRGILLPQVATEWGWDRETFAAQVCRKAGLSEDAWRRGAALSRFAADVFGEPQR